MPVRFCHSCGTRLSEPTGRFCQSCGAPLDEGAGEVPSPMPDPQPDDSRTAATDSPASPGPPDSRRSRWWLVAALAVIAVVAAGLVLLTSSSSNPTKSGKSAAVTTPPKPSGPGDRGNDGIELVYRGQPTGEAQTISGEEIEDAIAIIRKRVRSLGLRGASVSQLGAADIKVDLADGAHAARAIEALGSTAQLYFFDWEPNLIGPEQAIGGHPGQSAPPGPLKKLEAEWKAAGRDPARFEDTSLIASGAFPDAYSAALLAAEQEPDEECDNCSSGKTQYYLFGKGAPHKLLAGPEQEKSNLYESPTGEELPRDGIVIAVPVGTILVSELPTDETGKVDEAAQPGWFALKDNPALSGSEITEPKQEFTQGTGEPNVAFKFTQRGRENFQDVTRQIARRGQSQAIGPVNPEQAAALSGHFAVILDNEVKSRPIINFAENPDGIDGRVGAQISGGFSGEHGLETAQELATTLQIGALPIDLQLIRGQ